MKVYNGLELKPLFHSEIASSYILWQILNQHRDITNAFLKQFLDFEVKEIHNVAREKNYRGKGFIDLLIHCKTDTGAIYVLIEVKVHDYLSATAGQIARYFEAANEEHEDDEIYFIYLTQYKYFDDVKKKRYMEPGTINEFKKAKVKFHRQDDRLRHLEWEDFYQFMDQYKEHLSESEKLMLDLQKSWMREKTIQDLEDNQVEVGDRDLFDYFSDVKVNPVEELEGEKIFKNRRHIYSVDLARCNKHELNKVLEVIKQFTASKQVERKAYKPTEDATIEGVANFLQDLAKDQEAWNLLSFYAELFHYIDEKRYILLNGTGRSGFSIKIKIKNKGVISLCTLWKNQTIEFSLKR